jgi:hypothetical protein
MKLSKPLFQSILKKLGLRAEHPISEQKPAADEGNETEQNRCDAAPVTRTLIDIRDSIIEELHSNQKQEHADHKSNRTIAIIAVVVAAGYALVTLLLWCEAREANDLSRQNAIASERPWLGPFAGTIEDFAEGKTPTVEIFIQNFGKSPALNIEFGGTVTVVPANFNRKQFLEVLTRVSRSEEGSQFPGQMTRIGVPSIELTPDRYKGITAGNLHLVIVGTLVYRDTSQIEHHTWVYAVYALDKKMLMIQREVTMNLPLDD